MKTCPYCAEEIQDAAIVCKHCGREIALEAVSMVTQGLKRQPTTEPAPEPKPSQSGANHIQSTVESGPQPAEFPEEKIAPHERRPLWNSALRFGAIFAGLYLVYEIVQYSQGRMGAAEVQGNLLTGVMATVVAGTAFGFILVPLWRWQRWSPIVLVVLIPTGVLLFGGLQSGDISLGALGSEAPSSSPRATIGPVSTFDMYVDFDSLQADWGSSVVRNVKLYQSGAYNAGFATLMLTIKIDSAEARTVSVGFRAHKEAYIDFMRAIIRAIEEGDDKNPTYQESLFLAAYKIYDDFLEDYADYIVAMGFDDDYWVKTCQKLPHLERCN